MESSKFIDVKHGGNVPISWIDFSISVNPYFPDFFIDYEKELNQISMRYIYFEDIENSLSMKLNQKINLCAGTTESLYLLNMAFENDIVIEKSSYGEYERTARLFNKKIHYVDSIFEHDFKNCIVILNNPKNPNGNFYKYDEVDFFVKKNLNNNNIPVLDDAFLEFILFENNDWEKKWAFDGAIHLRTYTKSYSLPGIRLGYFIDNYNKMERYKMPWSIGSIGKLFLIKMIEDKRKFIIKSMQTIENERKRINSILNLKNKSPFFFIEIKDKGNLFKSLEIEKMMVRDCTSFGYENFIRFGIRTKNENDKLLATLLHHYLP
jgi:histidinol-phosphate aminotransferase